MFQGFMKNSSRYIFKDQKPWNYHMNGGNNMK
jgi:hypothetical protein